MKIKTVKVSDKGQIAIPTDIRVTIGIKRGDELVIVQKGNKILITKASKISKKMEDDFSDLLAFSELSLIKLWSYKGDDIWNKYLEK